MKKTTRKIQQEKNNRAAVNIHEEGFKHLIKVMVFPLKTDDPVTFYAREESVRGNDTELGLLSHLRTPPQVTTSRSDKLI